MPIKTGRGARQVKKKKQCRLKRDEGEAGEKKNDSIISLSRARERVEDKRTCSCSFNVFVCATGRNKPILNSQTFLTSQIILTSERDKRTRFCSFNVFVCATSRNKPILKRGCCIPEREEGVRDI